MTISHFNNFEDKYIKVGHLKREVSHIFLN